MLIGILCIVIAVILVVVLIVVNARTLSSSERNNGKSQPLGQEWASSANSTEASGIRKEQEERQSLAERELQQPGTAEASAAGERGLTEPGEHAAQAALHAPGEQQAAVPAQAAERTPGEEPGTEHAQAPLAVSEPSDQQGEVAQGAVHTGAVPALQAERAPVEVPDSDSLSHAGPVSEPAVSEHEPAARPSQAETAEASRVSIAKSGDIMPDQDFRRALQQLKQPQQPAAKEKDAAPMNDDAYRAALRSFKEKKSNKPHTP